MDGWMVNGLSNDQPFLNTSTLVSPEQWSKPWLFAVHIWFLYPVFLGLQLCKPLEGVLRSNQDFMGCHECRILNVVSSPWSRRQELQHHVTSKSEKKSEQSWVPNSLKSDVFFGDTCDLGFLWQWHHHRDHRDPGSVKITKGSGNPIWEPKCSESGEKKTSSSNKSGVGGCDVIPFGLTFITPDNVWQKQLGGAVLAFFWMTWS